MSRENETGAILGSLIVGALAGAVAALLLAPQSGQETRDQLAAEAEKLKEKLSKESEGLRKEIAKYADDFSEKAKQAKAELQEKLKLTEQELREVEEELGV